MTCSTVRYSSHGKQKGHVLFLVKNPRGAMISSNTRTEYKSNVVVLRAYLFRLTPITVTQKGFFHERLDQVFYKVNHLYGSKSNATIFFIGVGKNILKYKLRYYNEVHI